MSSFVPYIKIGISVLIILFLATNLDHASLLNTLKLANANFLVAASIIFFLGQILSARRYQILVTVCSGQLSFLYSLRIHFIGLFFNQILPSGMGGDVVKGIYASAILSIQQATMSVVADRAYGLVVMCFLILLLGPFYYSLLRNQEAFYLLILMSIAGTIWLPMGLFFFFIMKSSFARFHALILNRAPFPFIQSFLEYFRQTIMTRQAFELLAISLVIHFSGIAAYFLIALALGAEGNFFSYTLVVPLIFLFALAPISIAGWGVREVSSIWLLGKIGVSFETAFAISILFGLMLIVISLPGVFLFNNEKSK